MRLHVAEEENSSVTSMRHLSSARTPIVLSISMLLVFSAFSTIPPRVEAHNVGAALQVGAQAAVIDRAIVSARTSGADFSIACDLTHRC